jgi:hypothetical protein
MPLERTVASMLQGCDLEKTMSPSQAEIDLVYRLSKGGPKTPRSRSRSQQDKDSVGSPSWSPCVVNRGAAPRRGVHGTSKDT